MFVGATDTVKSRAIEPVATGVSTPKGSLDTYPFATERYKCSGSGYSVK